MANVVSSQNFAKALYPGVSTWFGKTYDAHKTEYTDLFETYTSRRAFEEDVYVSGFGLATVKEEGQGIDYDSEEQAFVTRYGHVVFAKGFIITREIFDDDLYDVVGERRAKALAFAMNQTKENVGANVFNRATNASYTGGDGVALLSTVHKRWRGANDLANKPSTDADLSESALEQACIDIMKFTDDRGLKISVMPRSLHIPPDLVFEAERILKSGGRVATADNDLNALKDMGKFPGGVKVNHYFTDTDAWFIRTNVENGMKHYVRNKLEFDIDNDFDTENAKYKARERYSFGWSDPRAVYGSTGA